MKFIYRIENKRGRGPYNSSIRSSKWKASDYRHIDDNHPTPSNDEGLYDFMDKQEHALFEYRFGFSSMKQLNRWFSAKERVKLEELGFHITLIPVNMCKAYCASKHQVMYILC